MVPYQLKERMFWSRTPKTLELRVNTPVKLAGARLNVKVVKAGVTYIEKP